MKQCWSKKIVVKTNVGAKKCFVQKNVKKIFFVQKTFGFKKNLSKKVLNQFGIKFNIQFFLCHNECYVK